MPLDWTIARNNLGRALDSLGERENGTARLEEAIVAYDGALEIFIAAGADRYATICRRNLNKALAVLDQRKSYGSQILPN